MDYDNKRAAFINSLPKQYQKQFIFLNCTDPLVSAIFDLAIDENRPVVDTLLEICFETINRHNESIKTSLNHPQKP